MEVPSNLTLKIGETYTLRLPGLGTAGYRWSYEIEGNATSIDVSKVEAEYQQPLPVGSSRDEVFVIRAHAIGRISIRFVQSRPWEKDQPPQMQHIIQIAIDV
ncbi:protease inhibitor I42 family protein [Pseudanabaena sp. PCC 6802]|uniref:protease inhibitor I42 family protein n=1 Tax=Pseudanabaena sp. PCC 6802 TaxID=118173 RepID=UPI000371FE58|nr:protease inhibitor I42 family protein [Pseudanabaena sp. PCC 6802]